jgi:RNA polymerase sigma-70 factor, ECF subfamily
MDELAGVAGHAELAEAFSQARPRLVRVAYAILGSHAEAEDVVADCWLRLTAAHSQGPVRDVESWAIVAVSRMAVDVLRSARVRREQYVGPWLPEPMVDGALPGGATSGAMAGGGMGGWGMGGGAVVGAVASGSASLGGDPADRVTLDEEVSYALLVVLEALSPSERAAFVLHDVFGMPFGEIASVVGRSPAAVRQLASRARQRVRADRSWPAVDAAEHRRVVAAFSVALNSGDLTALVQVLDPDVVLVSDGGGVVTSARRPILGADRVARFLFGIYAKRTPGSQITLVNVNGLPGFALYQEGELVTITSVTVADGRVARVDMIRTPAKLPRTPA